MKKIIKCSFCDKIFQIKSKSRLGTCSRAKKTAEETIHMLNFKVLRRMVKQNYAMTHSFHSETEAKSSDFKY